MLARQIVIGFGVAIIFPLLVYYGVRTFGYPPTPQLTFQQLPPQASAEERQDYAQRQRTRQEEFAAQSKSFARVLIYVSTPLGIAAILIGTFLRSPALGTGLLLGGIFTVSHGYWGYWSYADDRLRFGSLLLGFCVLLFVAYSHRPKALAESRSL